MLTIFATPKAFEGHIGIIQHNAIKSWTLLNPKPEIILFGDEKGTKEICQELNLKHIPILSLNEYGTPLLSDLFQQGQQLAKNDLVCYVNADIILMNDFIQMLIQVQKLKKPWLVTTRRWDVDITEPINFEKSKWQSELQDLINVKGVLREGGVDFFVFKKGLYKIIPSFAIGRNYWDDWICWEARRCGAMVINAADIVMAVHQNHSYSYLGGSQAWRDQPELQHNWRLIGGWQYIFCKSLPTHNLKKSGMVKSPFYNYFIHIFYRARSFVVQSTYNLRRSLGLYRWWIQRKKLNKE